MAKLHTLQTVKKGLTFISKGDLIKVNDYGYAIALENVDLSKIRMKDGTDPIKVIMNHKTRKGRTWVGLEFEGFVRLRTPIYKVDNHGELWKFT